MPALPNPRPSGLTRRQILPIAAAAVALPSLWRGAAAATGEAPLVDSLFNLAWIADGSPWQKHLYVLFAPWCPYCKALFHDSRGLVSGLQIRWIPAGSRDEKSRKYNVALARSRDVKVLNELFTTGAIADVTVPSFDSIDLNEGVIFSQSQELDRLIGRSYGFPTLVYPGKDGIVAMSGAPDDVGTLLKDVVGDGRYPPDKSTAPGLLARPLTETPIEESLRAFAKDKSVAMRALPFADAPQVDDLGGTSYRALARMQTDAGTWIAVSYLTNGIRAYVPEDWVELRPS